MRHRLLLLMSLALGCDDVNSSRGEPVDAGPDTALADAARSPDTAPADAAVPPADAPHTAPDRAAPDAAEVRDTSAPPAPDAAGDTAVPAPDAAGPCDENTFEPPEVCAPELVPDTPVEDWRHDTTPLLTTSQGDPDHRCLDAIFNPGDEIVLTGKFVYGPFDKDLVDEHVEVWLQVGCAWQRVASLLTSDDGQHGDADDGGRVFATVPADLALGPGEYPVRMLVKGDHSAARCTLAVWPAGTHAVVTDIDGTVTTREWDGLWSLFDPGSPDPHPGNRDVFAAWVSKGARPIFLTARPEHLTNGTRRWFADQGYPAGLFHLSPSDIGELGQGAAEYKQAWLTEAVAERGVVFEAAYGNQPTDLSAYENAGIPPENIHLFGLDGAHRIDDYNDEAVRVRCLPPLAGP